MRSVTLAIVAGTTQTAAIDGISAAGADSTLREHTPSADLEIVADGRPAPDSPVPVSPDGCPTPAVVTRAVRELVDGAVGGAGEGFDTAGSDLDTAGDNFDAVGVAAGLSVPTEASMPVYETDAAPGGDVRDAEPVPDAREIFERARELTPDVLDGAGSDTPDELFVAETIPGGTTTALGVLTALGERPSVSSSLATNPVARKRRVVEEGLVASGLDPGDAAGTPVDAVRLMGDPVLAAAAGLAVGAVEEGVDVTLAGGTQMATVAALARHAGVDGELSLATTAFVADDPTADVAGLAADLDIAVTATDPAFDESDHPAMRAYARGEAKEGVGMGGALALAERAGVPASDVRERVAAITDRLLAERRKEAADAPIDGGRPL